MASSSTSSANKSFKYDVFLSFRGADTRKNFVDHLYAALAQQGISTFKDDEQLIRGKRDRELLKSIEDSKMFIVVFSRSYASSRWCLNELEKIMEYHNRTDRTVFPVFYDVEPSEVRKQSAAVGEAFARFDDVDAAGKWRAVLKQAADLTGWELKKTADGHEAEFIKLIVEQISAELRSISINLSVDEKLVGMESRIKDVESCLEVGLDDVRMIGIWGMGGCGKTTLAKAVFKKICFQFEGRSFVDNVREASEKNAAGLKSLQEKVLSDVLNEEGINLSSVSDGKRMMKTRLQGKKVLLVLDDVDDMYQLEALAGARDWFKPGSRIVITTRDSQLLKAHGVNQIHVVNLLSSEEAIILFSRYAFGQEIPTRSYEALSLQVVSYAAGLPLSLTVLGSFLRGKDKLEWIGTLEKLKTVPLREVMNMLKLSYDILEEHEKEVFLDVACFMKGWDINYAIEILESCGFYAKLALKVLEQKSFITVTNDVLGMHDLIQEMGRHIVHQESPSEPNKRSRLWTVKEIEDVLANDLEANATRCIKMDSPVKLKSVIVTKGFRKMKNLRMLHMASEIDDDYECGLEIDQVRHSFPNTLRCLSWVGYPHLYLPKSFEANNLVRLEMHGSRIVQLWEGERRKVLNMLRFLDLSFSRIRSLDLYLTPNLERLVLEGCDDLVELYTPFGCLERLVYLDLSGCLRLHSLLFIKRLESLEVLCLNRFFMKEFPDVIPEHCNNSLRELEFRYNDIKELDSSIENLQKLVYLDLHSCRRLKNIPRSICGLRHLRRLHLYGCNLEELPKDIGLLECLEELNLSFASIKHLPDGICMLKRLKTLDLSSCLDLEKLPQDLGQLESLENLILKECSQIRDIPDSICMLKHLKILILLDCVLLEKLPEAFGSLDLQVLNVNGTRIKHLPRSIYLLKDLKIYGSVLGPRSRDFESTSRTLEANLNVKRKIDVDKPPQEQH